MKRSSYDTNINESKLNNSEISYNTNKMTDEQLVNAISELLKDEKQNAANNEQLNIDKDVQLTVLEDDNCLIEEKKVNFIKRLWRKIVNLFKSKNSTERIGE